MSGRALMETHYPIQDISTRGNDDLAFLLLAKGGETPGLHQVDVFEGRSNVFKEMERGHTPYALAFSPSMDRFAIGTKRGQVQIYGSATGEHELGADPVCAFDFDEGILAVCFADDSTLLVSTLQGEVARADLVAGSRRVLSVLDGTPPVCAFAHYEKLGVLALAADGGVYRLEPPFLKATRVITGPAPSRPVSCVQVARWPSDSCLTYPAVNGGLAVVELTVPQIRVSAAHEGDFSCLLESGDRLLTIGRQDGTVKAWESSSMTPVVTYAGPLGTISGGLLATVPTRVLLVDESGAAGIYELSDDRLQLIDPIGIENCRVVVSPPADALAKSVERFKHAEAERIKIEFLDSRYRRNRFSSEGQHTALCNLGHKPMSLRLRALHATDEGDSNEAVHHRMQMIKALHEDCGDPESLYEAATHAASLGCFEMALDFFQDLDRQYPGMVPERDHECIRKRVQQALHQPLIMDLGEAATILHVVDFIAEFGLPSPRKYVVKHYEAFHCAAGDMAVDGLAAYLDGWSSDIDVTYTYTATRLLWIDHYSEEQIDTCVIGQRAPARFASPELAIKVCSDQERIVLEPVAVIVFPSWQPPLDEAKTDYCTPLFDAWFNDSHAWLKRRLQELSNRTLAKKRWKT